MWGKLEVEQLIRCIGKSQLGLGKRFSSGKIFIPLEKDSRPEPELTG